MRVLQKPLHLVPQPHAVAGQLLPGARHGPPQPLLRIGYEAQNQLSGYESSHQALGVLKIPLATFRCAIRVRLRQMQLAHSLQLLPDGSPILGRRLHDRLAHPLFHQPVRQLAQLPIACAELALLEPELARLAHIAHHYRQHHFVNINAGYLVNRFHSSFLGKRGRLRQQILNTVSRFSPTPYGVGACALVHSKRSPDHAETRPQLIHCFNDLRHPSQQIGCNQDSASFSLLFVAARRRPFGLAGGHPRRDKTENFGL